VQLFEVECGGNISHPTDLETALGWARDSLDGYAAEAAAGTARWLSPDRLAKVLTVTITPLVPPGPNNNRSADELLFDRLRGLAKDQCECIIAAAAATSSPELKAILDEVLAATAAETAPEPEVAEVEA
jgi:hypothetical protein